MPRLFTDEPLRAGAFALPARAARHAQVLRLQPGDALTLFDGRGGEWSAVVRDMRRQVEVEVGAHHAVEREAACAVTLAVGMPANERMDWLVEKATELGVAAVQPLVTERSVVRLSGERADKRRAHWQAIAIAACEQCGRNRVPAIEPVRALRDALAALGAADDAQRLLLSPQAGRPLRSRAPRPARVVCLSGPEGGLSAAEAQAAQAAGFVAVGLGPRVLRAETAAVLALGLLTAA